MYARILKTGYRIIRRLSTTELDELSDRLVERFSSREKNDINRISQVVSLINHTGCQTNFLLDYFGEHRDQSCGHCEFCLSTTGEEDRPARVAINTVRPTVHWETRKEQLQDVLAENHASLQSPRQQARFFCGIRSPQSTRAGLQRHASFGRLADLPFTEVFNHCFL